MSIVTLLLVIVVVGFLLWLVEAYVPMNPTVKRILIGLVIFVLVIWILQQLGLLGSVRNIRIN